MERISVQEKWYFHSYAGGCLWFCSSSAAHLETLSRQWEKGGLVNTFSAYCCCVFSLEGMPWGCFFHGSGVCKQAVQRQPTLWQSDVARCEVCVKCVFVFLAFPLILAHLEAAKEWERLCVSVSVRVREATPNPMGHQWVMNYSLSEAQHWRYHRACRCTGMTVVTAPRKDLVLTSDTSS